MAQKTRKLEEILSIHGEAAKVISYADYFVHRPLFSSLQIKNEGGETIERLTISVQNDNGMLLPTEKEIDVPFESAVQVDFDNILSPLYFSNIDKVAEEKVIVTLRKDKKVILTKEWTLTTMPFDYWQGTEGDAELLASFVRPKLGDCARVRTEVLEQLKKWNTPCELGSYIGNDKNAVRRIIAAIYAVFRRFSILKKPGNIAEPVAAGAGVKILTERKASTLEMALFACSCLESMGLHPVLVFGEKEVTAGVWLYDSCFLDTVSDDMQRLDAYIAEGINNVSCFDVEDLFSDKNAAYSTSEGHFRQKLQEGYYDTYVDVRRCRMSRVFSLPLRAKSVKGYELLSEEDMSHDAAPKELREMQKLSLDTEETRDKQWERRLLDLSMKNTLLHFNPSKMAVKLLSASADATLDALTEQDELVFAPATDAVKAIAQKKEYFGIGTDAKQMRELVALENQSGIVRTYLEAPMMNELLGKLIRKNKESYEESGAKILYLSMGFLKWYSRGRYVWWNEKKIVILSRKYNQYRT